MSKSAFIGVLLLGLALNLAACSKSRQPVVINNLTGTIVELDTKVTDPNDLARKTKAWSGGAGDIKAQIGFELIKVGNVDEKGNFNIDLPKNLKDSNLRKISTEFTKKDSEKCKGSLEFSDTEAKMVYALLRVDAVRNGALVNGSSITQRDIVNPKEPGQFEVVTTTSREGFLVYFDRPVRIIGNRSCTLKAGAGLRTTNHSVMYNFGQGWNFMMGESKLIQEPGLTTEYINGVSERLPSRQWTLR